MNLYGSGCESDGKSAKIEKTHEFERKKKGVEAMTDVLRAAVGWLVCLSARCRKRTGVGGLVLGQGRRRRREVGQR